MRPTSDRFKILGVPLGLSAFVFFLIRNNIDAIYVSLTRAANNSNARISHNVHRVTASSCRMSHLLHFIKLADAMTLWRYLDE